MNPLTCTKIGTGILLILSVIVICSSPVSAQFEMFPDWDWREIQTTHFRVYYPEPYSEWTESIVSKMESIHERVAAFVGYAETEGPIDVIVMDPYAMPNGMAIPFLDYPRIILWTTAPDTPMIMGQVGDWGEIVMTHEYGHILHLTRPPRSWSGRLLAWFLPVGPIAMKSPAWVIEGYAVMLESMVTGAGRAQSSLRAGVIRTWAVEGKLPNYQTLDALDGWMAGDMRYLVGSAFLEWLQTRSGNPDCLLHLWKRLSAKTNRDFNEAFIGVFRDEPEDLYDRFRAEMIATAIGIENELSGMGRLEGEKWLELDGFTGYPDISPDGKSMAVVTRPMKGSARLNVWSMQETDDKKDKKDQKKKDKHVEDPEDVPDLPSKPPARKDMYHLVERNGISPIGPRWFPDGQSLVFHSYMPQPDGTLHPDLFRWFPESGRLDRLTVGADLKWPDPIPGADALIAVHQRFGRCSLVHVALPGTEITELTTPAIDVVIGTPRVSPDGRRVAFTRHQKGRIHLAIMELPTGAIQAIDPDDHEIISNPVWSPDGDHIFLTVDRYGIFNIEQWEFRTGNRRELTRMIGGALSPEPAGSSGNELYFLSLTTKGLDIRVLGEESGGDLPSLSLSSQYPVMPPNSVPPAQPFDKQAVPPSRPYSAARHLEFNHFFGGTFHASGKTYEMGFREGDLLGRFNTLAIGSFGKDGGVTGGTIHTAYRGLPVALSSQVFYALEEPSKQPDAFLTVGNGLDHQTYGATLSTNGRYLGTRWSVHASLDGMLSWIKFRTPSDEWSDPVRRDALSAHGRAAWFPRWGQLSMITELDSRYIQGWTDDQDWQHLHYQGRWGVSYEEWTLAGMVYRGELFGEPGPCDRFQLGGTITSVQAPLTLCSRIPVPYYPAGLQTGDSAEWIRGSIGIGMDPGLVLFADRVAVWTDGSDREYLRALGSEINVVLPPLSILRMPATRMTLGAAYGLDDPLKEKWRGYLSVTLRP